MSGATLGEHSTADEVRAKKVAAMGAELGGLHCDLWNELSWLHAKWKQYCALFGTSEKRVNVMNEVAPNCTFIIQSALWRDILLALCRMTDPAESEGRPNVSLLAMVPHIGDASFREEVAASATEARTKCRFARERRNRYFAHSDLFTARNTHPVPLPDANRRSVSEAMAAIVATMNMIQYKFENSRTMYELTIDVQDAEMLYKSVEEFAEVQRRKRQARLDELERWRNA